MAGEFNDNSEFQGKDDMDLDDKNKQSFKSGQMDIDESCREDKFSENNKLVRNIGKVVNSLRNIGFTSMAENAYASAIFLLLKVKLNIML